MSRRNLLKGFKMPKGITFEHVENDKFRGKFVAYPFERGYGITIGNSLRRILLSSIQGCAISAIRVTHYGPEGEPRLLSSEFEMIPGVVEDTQELIANIKQIQLSLPDEVEQRTYFVECKTPGVYTAGKIFENCDVTVTNPDFVVMTLENNVNFEIEFQVELGRGYVPAETNEKYVDVVGTIPVDALFSPVKAVKIDIENTRVGQRNDYDKLILEVETNGAITPEDAIAEAAKIAKEHYTVFINFDEESISSGEEEDEEEKKIRQLLETPVEELELSVRSSNCLKNAMVKTIGDLTRLKEDDIQRFRNFGKKSLTEIREKLKSWGLSLGMTDYSVLKASGKYQINKEEDDEA